MLLLEIVIKDITSVPQSGISSTAAIDPILSLSLLLPCVYPCISWELQALGWAALPHGAGPATRSLQHPDAAPRCTPAPKYSIQRRPAEGSAHGICYLHWKETAQIVTRHWISKSNLVMLERVLGRVLLVGFWDAADTCGEAGLWERTAAGPWVEQSMVLCSQNSPIT